MLEKIKKILLFSDLSRSEGKEVWPQITKENRRFCVTWSIVYVVFWGYSMVMTFFDPLYHQCRNIYIVAFIFSAIALYLSVFFAAKHPLLVMPISLTLDEVLMISGILIARHLAPRTIVVFAAVLIVPVLFITDTLSTIVLLVTNILLCALIGSPSMEPDTFRWVLSNVCIFSILGLMLGHFVNKARFERYVFAESNAKFAETQARYARCDQLTNLRNSRAFTEIIDQLQNDPPAGYRVVMADVNELKHTNDTLGHHAGDELIAAAAECFRRSFKDTDKIYRTGGDEFCVIITDEGYDVEGALAELKKSSTEWQGDLIRGFSLSAGYAAAEEGDDVNDVVRAAEKEMYTAKRNYYIQSGKDRRR